MAGLGEACSPVGALHFYIEAANKMKDSVTVTGEKVYWVRPSNQQVQCKEISDIDFSSPKRLEKKNNHGVCQQQPDIKGNAS